MWVATPLFPLVDWAVGVAVELGAQIVPWFTGRDIPERDAGITQLLLVKSASGGTAAIRQVKKKPCSYGQQQVIKVWLY